MGVSVDPDHSDIKPKGTKVMRHTAICAVLVASFAAAAGFSTPSHAETGQVAVVFTKGGFIVGVGGGEGVLVPRANNIPSPCQA